MDASWVVGADGSHFPIQNLPFGIFSHAARGLDPRPGVAIGDSVLDLRQTAAEGLLDELPFHAPSVFGGDSLNDFMARPRADWQAVRAWLTGLLGRDATDVSLRDRPDLQARCLVPRAEVRMHLPAQVGDYTDFYSSREHASNVGEMFRGKGNELQPNWLHLPVGYHGRASSVVVSGTPVVRPKGQLQLDKTDPTKGTEHAPCRLLDFELEMGFFVGGAAPPLGTPLTMEQAAERIFGFVLCNDWSARDIQKFEYVPLGPFGAKNFATTISAWVVTVDALAPFACPTSAGVQEPTPLPYLQDPSYSSYDVALSVEVAPGADAVPTTVSESNYRHMYWSCKQQLVHHAVTGCDMRPGDLLASGTISGDAPHKLGSMLELSWQACNPTHQSLQPCVVTVSLLCRYCVVTVSLLCRRAACAPPCPTLSLLAPPSTLRSHGRALGRWARSATARRASSSRTATSSRCEARARGRSLRSASASAPGRCCPPVRRRRRARRRHRRARCATCRCRRTGVRRARGACVWR